jgi:hypothetical protein
LLVPDAAESRPRCRSASSGASEPATRHTGKLMSRP